MRVDLVNDFARLPLHRATVRGVPVWYVITDVSDPALARKLGLNFAPKLANLPLGCPGCVAVVRCSARVLGRSPAVFNGLPDFKPDRLLVPGPSAFPPRAARPGAVAGVGYSPFVRIKGTTAIYNAPVVAVGAGPFDVVKHRNTHDRLLAIDTKKMTADLGFIRGFANGKPILYLSFDASDPVTAVIERSTFTPGLGLSPFPNPSRRTDTARAAIFTFANTRLGAHSPPSDGLAHVIVDGGNRQDLNLQNTSLLRKLRIGGDAHNIFDVFPTLRDRSLALLYSPIWDLQIGVWTPEAVRAGLNVAQTDANTIRQLAVRGLVTSGHGLPLASAHIIINCPPVAFVNDAPREDQAPKPASQP